MKTARAIISRLAFSLCMAILGANAAMAQAYVNQATGARQGSAYVPQVSPELRPMRAKRPLPARRTTALNGVKSTARPAIAAPVFPSVGAGSSAIVKASIDDSAWPTVGKGSVSRQ